MMALSHLLSTARDALQAQSFGVSVTSQNITQANTPGYVRREAVLQSRVMGQQDYGSVEALGVRRATDAFLGQQYLSSSAQTADAQERDLQMTAVEGLLNDFAGLGLGNALDKMRGSFQKLSATPQDIVAREEVLGALGDFVDRSNEVGASLANQRSAIFGQMTAVSKDVNLMANELATLNEEIIQATAQGREAADLKDKRAQVLGDLAPLVNLKVVDQADGGVLVQASGATLVEGKFARQFEVDLDSSGSTRLNMRRSDGTLTDVTSGLASGKLAGLREARENDLVAVTSELDALVYDVATAMNTQHQSGFALDGSTNLQLFDLTAVSSAPAGAARGIRLSTDILNAPEKVAASDSLATAPGSGVNALALTEVFDQPVAGAGLETPGNAYANIIASVGRRKAVAANDLELRSAMKDQYFQMKESISGVSLDEEMVALTKYQRAYQAASKVLTTVDEMLEELMTRLA
ncbi:MAG: flagellar hook-associated protein FlgK [Polyangiaceae bacterium]|nr:flagellar hook-associated protein FlgK [Polyangiaceae bacterium]